MISRAIRDVADSNREVFGTRATANDGSSPRWSPALPLHDTHSSDDIPCGDQSPSEDRPHNSLQHVPDRDRGSAPENDTALSSSSLWKRSAESSWRKLKSGVANNQTTIIGALSIFAAASIGFPAACQLELPVRSSEDSALAQKKPSPVESSHRKNMASQKTPQ